MRTIFKYYFKLKCNRNQGGNNMNDYTIKELEYGTIRSLTNGYEELLCYETKDPICNQVILVKKGDTLVSIEAPLFKDNVNELNSYVKTLGVKNIYVLLVDHVSPKDYLPEAKLLSTEEAIKSLTNGSQIGLYDGFCSTFTGKIQNEVRTDYETIKDMVELGGIKLEIKSKGEDFDVYINSFKAVYTHMLGHDVHSIIAGKAHADAIINELNSFLERGIEVVLSSHYIPENSSDIKTKIDYINNIKTIASCSNSRAEFVEKVKETYSTYSGLNYLDITASIFFQN